VLADVDAGRLERLLQTLPKHVPVGHEPARQAPGQLVSDELVGGTEQPAGYFTRLIGDRVTEGEPVLLLSRVSFDVGAMPSLGAATSQAFLVDDV
jgi:hypothetical protein